MSVTLEENRISKLGLLPKMISIMKSEKILDPRKLADRMNNDDEVWRKLDGKSLYPSDIRRAKDQAEQMTGDAISTMIVKEKESKKLITLIHERMSIIISQMDRYNAILDNLMNYIEKEQGEGRQPVSEIKAGLTVMESARKIVMSVREDEDIKKFISAGTINVSSGISMEEALDLAVKVGQELGHNKEEVVRAFAASRARPQPTIIDVVALKPEP